jgi:hypothetical protein
VTVTSRRRARDCGRRARHAAQRGELAEAVAGREHAPPLAGGTDLDLAVENDEEAVVLLACGEQGFATGE